MELGGFDFEANLNTLEQLEDEVEGMERQLMALSSAAMSLESTGLAAEALLQVVGVHTG